MRAAVLREGKIEVRQTADPVPGPGEVLVRTRLCGICASDVHAIEHGAVLASDPSGTFDFDGLMTRMHGTYAGSNTCTGPFDHGRFSMSR